MGVRMNRDALESYYTTDGLTGLKSILHAYVDEYINICLTHKVNQTGQAFPRTINGGELDALLTHTEEDIDLIKAFIFEKAREASKKSNCSDVLYYKKED